MGCGMTAIAGCGRLQSAGPLGIGAVLDWGFMVMAVGWGLWCRQDGVGFRRWGGVERSIMWRRGGAVVEVVQ
jgi:hypothetical protein